jgi:hypothetical protein
MSQNATRSYVCTAPNCNATYDYGAHADKCAILNNRRLFRNADRAINKTMDETTEHDGLTADYYIVADETTDP